MYKKSAQQLDSILETIISDYCNLMNQHGCVVEEFVSDYRKSRLLEIEEYRRKLALNEPAIKPCLLALVVRKKPITSAKIYQGYLPSENPPMFAVINLARISGSYTEHISQVDKSGGYPSRRVANMRSLRISTPNQKEWIVGVINQVNALNAAAEQFKLHYLDAIRLHYTGHRYLTSLQAMDLA